MSGHAQGLTTPQIAGKLYLSPETVDWHWGHVYRKLGVSSRRHAWPGRVLTAMHTGRGLAAVLAVARQEEAARRRGVTQAGLAEIMA